MNDDYLTTAVKESVASVHMDIPAEKIVSRSRAIRARRRIPVLAGGLAVGAGAALAVTTLSASHQPGRPATAQLAAWTVTTQADGGIRVTIHELRDPAGLQRTLRADGVSASVTFVGHPNPACQGYAGGGGTPGQRRHLLKSVYSVGPRAANVRVIVIHPSGLPSGAGVLIAAGFKHSPPGHGDSIALTMGLVQASPECTGS
jgi:hypothetical protein